MSLVGVSGVMLPSYYWVLVGVNFNMTSNRPTPGTTLLQGGASVPDLKLRDNTLVLNISYYLYSLWTYFPLLLD